MVYILKFFVFFFIKSKSIKKFYCVLKQLHIYKKRTTKLEKISRIGIIKSELNFLVLLV